MSDSTPQLRIVDASEVTLGTEEHEKPLVVAEVRQAIVDCRGNISAVARTFYRSRSRMNDYIMTKPELAGLVSDLREEILDKAEDNVFAAVEKGDLGQSNMVLMTLGKKRGWTNKLEVGTGDAPPAPLASIVYQQYPDDPAEDSAPDEETDDQRTA